MPARRSSCFICSIDASWVHNLCCWASWRVTRQHRGATFVSTQTRWTQGDSRTAFYLDALKVSHFLLTAQQFSLKQPKNRGLHEQPHTVPLYSSPVTMAKIIKIKLQIYLQLASFLHTLIQTTAKDCLEGGVCENDNGVNTEWSGVCEKLIPVSASLSTHTHTLPYKIQSRTGNLSFAEGTGKDDSDTGAEIRDGSKFSFTTCWSASPWSRHRDTSCSSSGSDPCSSRALKHTFTQVRVLD